MLYWNLQDQLKTCQETLFIIEKLIYLRKKISIKRKWWKEISGNSWVDDLRGRKINKWKINGNNSKTRNQWKRVSRDNNVSQQWSTQSYDDDECIEARSYGGAESFKR